MLGAVTRTYAVVGTGAVGGFYGAKLAAAGTPVRFLARSDLGHLRAHGLVVDSPLGDLRLPEVEAHGDPADIGPADVVLVALKTTGNGALAALLPPLVGPATVVVVLQNGLGVDERAAAAAPDATVLGGLCFICARKAGPGHVQHLDYGAVNIGEHRGGGAAAGITPAVEAVVGDLQAAGIEATAEADLVAARWRKLVWNVPFNGLSVVLDAGTDALLADPSARGLVEDLMAEVVAGSVAVGHPVDPAFVGRMLAYTEQMVPYAPSMKLDADASRPLEVEAIYKAPVRAAATAGCAMPRVEALERQLRFLDRRLG
ncbi:putative 2-dehydropantoate 2-reductase [soil metagenome]